MGFIPFYPRILFWSKLASSVFEVGLPGLAFVSGALGAWPGRPRLRQLIWEIPLVSLVILIAVYCKGLVYPLLYATENAWSLGILVGLCQQLATGDCSPGPNRLRTSPVGWVDQLVTWNHDLYGGVTAVVGVIHLRS
jgi:hypothetical protein